MYKVVAIGGSAGSLPVFTQILDALPARFTYTVIIVIHRMRNVLSEMNKVLVFNREELSIREPDDKETIRKGRIYLAPQNYHLLIEDDKTFSLDASEAIHYSRPSIDVTFESVASIYGKSAVGILLSGANQDGASGLSAIIEAGGIGIVQDPLTAEYITMPSAAISKNEHIRIKNTKDIIKFISTMNT